MYKVLDATIRSLTPIMYHNGRLADPLDPYAKQLKELTSKRDKTDADYEAIGHIEWEGGLYLDENRRVIFPGENIEAALIEGGSKNKLGPKFKAGLLCDGAWPLEYDGPKDFERLKADPRFRDRRGICVNRGSRTMRTRPIFIPWSLSFTLQYLPDLLNEAQVLKALEIVGQIIGIGDFTPKYGRFEVIKPRKMAKAG